MYRIWHGWSNRIELKRHSVFICMINSLCCFFCSILCLVIGFGECPGLTHQPLEN